MRGCCVRRRLDSRAAFALASRMPCGGQSRVLARRAGATDFASPKLTPRQMDFEHSALRYRELFAVPLPRGHAPLTGTLDYDASNGYARPPRRARPCCAVTG